MDDTDNLKIYTEDEEKLFIKLLAKKDLDFLIEKKFFYKMQLTHIFDMEEQIKKFKEQIHNNISEIQQILFKKCKHDWMKSSDGSYDEHPDYICTICESDYC